MQTNTTTRLDARELLDKVDGYFGRPKTDHRGERWVDCPSCGRSSTPSNKHFSYGARGGFCFACQYKTGLFSFASELRLIEDAPRAERRVYVPPPVTDAPPSAPAWWASDVERLAEKYADHPRVVSAWQSYKPVSSRTIDRWSLGVGRLPARRPGAWQRNDRLIVPIRVDGEIVSFFGRATQRGAIKWLPAANAPSTRWLWNLDGVRPGGVVWIVENVIDAMLIMQAHPEYDAVKPTSLALRDEWSGWARVLAEKNPSLVVVAFDNDLAGNGGGAHQPHLVQAWRDKMRQSQPDRWQHLKPPRPAAPRIARALDEAGLPVQIYAYPDGAPVGVSVADLLFAE